MKKIKEKSQKRDVESLFVLFSTFSFRITLWIFLELEKLEINEKYTFRFTRKFQIKYAAGRALTLFYRYQI